MGYVKYREDDIRLNDDRMFLKRGPGLELKEVPTIYECRLCHKVFDEKDALHAHIKANHNIVSPLLLLNGKIAGKETKLSKVNSAKISFYGYSLPVFLDNEQISCEAGSDEADITEILKKALISHHCCRITYGNEEQYIEYNPQSLLSWGQMAPKIKKWQNTVENGKIPEYDIKDSFRGDRDFLRGMYNYFVGCVSGYNKSTRYDEAYELLSSFDYDSLPEVGRCALKVIAFRRNWIRQLTSYTTMENDVFRVASDFFNWKESKLVEEDLEPITCSELYIEDNSKQCLDFILLFQRGKFQEAEAGIMSSNFDIADSNQSNQLDFFRARIAIVNGRKREAQKYADRITVMSFRDSCLNAISEMR